METAVTTIAETFAPPEVWQYGVLGVVAFGFAFAIVKMFRLSRLDSKRHADREREWALERSDMKATHEKAIIQMDKETEQALKENAESYAMRLEEMRDQYQAREDGIRNEFAVRLERIATEANNAATKQNEVLNKIYERFVGPRRGGRSG